MLQLNRRQVLKIQVSFFNYLHFLGKLDIYFTEIKEVNNATAEEKNI